MGKGTLMRLAVILPFIWLAQIEIASSEDCVSCHERNNPSLVDHWKASRHASADVSCIDCHQAAKSESDAFEHYGSTIAVIVSPLDCGRCHDAEQAENSASRHAHAAEFIGSLDNVLGEIVEGTPAATSGCRQCHG